MELWELEGIEHLLKEQIVLLQEIRDLLIAQNPPETFPLATGAKMVAASVKPSAHLSRQQVLR
jgi:hypothetical protein